MSGGSVFDPEFWSWGAPIPKNINFIWVGEHTLPERYLLNILLCAQQNKANYNIQLWVNPEYFTDRDNPKYAAYQLLEKHGVKLKNYKDLRSTTDEAVNDVLASIDKVHQLKPVVAADLLRLVILRQQGGYYMDTDSHFLAPMPTWPVKLLHDKKFIFELVAGGLLSLEVHTNNSFLAAAKDSPEVRAILEMLQESLKDKEFKDVEHWNRYEVIAYSGAGLIESALSNYYHHPIVSNADRLALFKAHGLAEYASLSSIRRHSGDTTWLVRSAAHTAKLAAEERRAAHVLKLWQKEPRVDLGIAYALPLEKFAAPVAPVIPAAAGGAGASSPAVAVISAWTGSGSTPSEPAAGMISKT